MRIRTAFRIVKYTVQGVWEARDELPGYLLVLLGIALLPIPGPVDEIVGLVAAGIMWMRHRALLTEIVTSAYETALVQQYLEDSGDSSLL